MSENTWATRALGALASLAGVLAMLVQVAVVVQWSLPPEDLGEFPWSVPLAAVAPVVAPFRATFGDVGPLLGYNGVKLHMDLSPVAATAALLTARALLSARPASRALTYLLCWAVLLAGLGVLPSPIPLKRANVLDMHVIRVDVTREAISLLTSLSNPCLRCLYTGKGLTAGFRATVVEVLFRRAPNASFVSGLKNLAGLGTFGFLSFYSLLLKVACARLVYGALRFQTSSFAWGALGVLALSGIEQEGGFPAELVKDGWPKILGAGKSAPDAVWVLQVLAFHAVCRPSINLVGNVLSVMLNPAYYPAILTLRLATPHDWRRYIFIVKVLLWVGVLSTLLVENGLITPDGLQRSEPPTSSRSTIGAAPAVAFGRLARWAARVWAGNATHHDEM